VPYYISTDNHAFPLSLSGRYALNTIYITTWYEANYDIYTKMVSSTASNLKIASTNVIDHQTMENNKLFLNQKTDAIVSFKLFDITGKLLVNESGSIQKIKNMFSVENLKIPHGVYLIKLLISDGKNYLSQKIVF
jgi:hypothetical protein